jgi:hypothetical protein
MKNVQFRVQAKVRVNISKKIQVENPKEGNEIPYVL